MVLCYRVHLLLSGARSLPHDVDVVADLILNNGEEVDEIETRLHQPEVEAHMIVNYLLRECVYGQSRLRQ